MRKYIYILSVLLLMSCSKTKTKCSKCDVRFKNLSHIYHDTTYYNCDENSKSMIESLHGEDVWYNEKYEPIMSSNEMGETKIIDTIIIKCEYK